MNNSFILTSDWHIRADNPSSRIDDFQKVQTDTLDFIFTTASDTKSDIIIAGDIFHRSQPAKSQYLENKLINYLRSFYHNVFAIPGNHDLLYHSYERRNECSYGVIANHFNNNVYDFISLIPFNTDLSTPKSNSIIVLHHFIDPEFKNFTKKRIGADWLFDNYDFKICVTGDNHEGFIIQKKDKIIVNPGCITRQKSDTEAYKPFIVQINIETLEHKMIYLPDNILGVFDISLSERPDQDFTSFLELLQNNNDLNIDFRSNIVKICEKEGIDSKYLDRILSYVDRCDDG